MSKRVYQIYSDEFIAEALVMLEAQGYPHKRGAIQETAKQLDIPRQTLMSWHKSNIAERLLKFQQEKIGHLSALIADESIKILDRMGQIRDEATYRDLAIAIGILLDKLQNLRLLDTGIERESDDSAKSDLLGRIRRIITVEESQEVYRKSDE